VRCKIEICEVQQVSLLKNPLGFIHQLCISLPAIWTVLFSFVIFCPWFTKPPAPICYVFFQLTYLLPSCFSIFFKNQLPPYESIFPFYKRNWRFPSPSTHTSHAYHFVTILLQRNHHFFKSFLCLKKTLPMPAWKSFHAWFKTLSATFFLLVKFYYYFFNILIIN